MKKLQGIYLVIDPAREEKLLLEKLTSALLGGIDLLQIWNNWPEGSSRQEKLKLIAKIMHLAAEQQVPVLINEEWELLAESGLQGVHFDSIPAEWELIKSRLESHHLLGLTVGNDRQRIDWAVREKFDYLSFCAMFPSPSVGSCEIVKPSSVIQARQLCDLPLFLSGGIEPDNLLELGALDFQGIAIISGIMKARLPADRANEYRQILKQLNKI